MINKNTLTPAEGKKLINDFYSSKLKASKFCQQKNISYHILQYWKKKYSTLQSNNNSSQTMKQEFLPINVPTSKPNNS